MSQEIILRVADVWEGLDVIRPRFPVRADSPFVPHGRYKYVREDGCVAGEITYEHGVVQGAFVHFWPSGRVEAEGQFQEGRREGIWHYYEADGAFREIVEYEYGNEVIDWDQFFGVKDVDQSISLRGTMHEIGEKVKRSEGADPSA